ncbi:proton-conducting transporter transmembrane domain-containing protein [Plastoroseomonas arctica]|uniref:Hydrogenase 4 subunit B n=1 Tax=Plastoroseomonas arctica TaxID=1509237 RepID=A0AAF1KJJ9_9PROT|nr:proton-conducting transporter membrane subunit [Plastoroseomonas arctica]MBR0655320.1 hydrogenase 4 subunit B [Plastoroseomonas arctica]
MGDHRATPPAVLTALLTLLAALLALAAVGAVRASRTAGVVHAGTAAVCGGFCAVAVLALVLPAAPALALPFGPFWGPSMVALDGLSAWFLLILGLSGGASSLAALGYGGGAMPARLLVPWPLFLAAMALTLAAADAFTLLLGFEAMSLASWALVAAEHDRAENRRAARLYLVFAIFAAACLIPVVGLLAIGPEAVGFAALRETPPEGLRATLILGLVLAGAGAKAGLVPFHAWLPLAHPAAPSHVSAVMSGAMTKVALYVMARVLFDLCGPAQPLWWGAPLLALGAASALLGALRANMEEDSKVLLACSTIENIGLIVMAMGLVLAFRGADLAPLAALAAGAALLHALNHGVFKTLLFLGAGAVLHAALTRRLDSMGGLIRPMPWTAAAVMVGAGAAAALPPLSGFASEWLLLQSLLAGWRTGALGFQITVAAATAIAALSAALAAAAMVRFVGMAFLGRPRTPRAAGASEHPGAERIALVGLAALTVAFGILPAPLLDLAAGGVRLLSGGAGRPVMAALGLAAGDGAARLWPAGVFLLLALIAGAVVVALRARGARGFTTGPAWACGFMAPPPHLPFGDPLTQPSAAGLAQPLRRMLGGALLGAEERVTMPDPGDPRAATIATCAEDPAFPYLLAPLARLRDALAGTAERLRDLSIRQCLMLSFSLLIAMLALVAVLERG